jgi:hypothetical protein
MTRFRLGWCSTRVSCFRLGYSSTWVLHAMFLARYVFYQEKQDGFAQAAEPPSLLNL